MELNFLRNIKLLSCDRLSVPVQAYFAVGARIAFFVWLSAQRRGEASGSTEIPDWSDAGDKLYRITSTTSSQELACPILAPTSLEDRLKFLIELLPALPVQHWFRHSRQTILSPRSAPKRIRPCPTEDHSHKIWRRRVRPVLCPASAMLCRRKGWASAAV